MRRSAPVLVSLAIAAILAGCGGDAKEEAPVIPTGDAIALAPPNAVGADVPRPGGATPTLTGPTKIEPQGKKPPPVPLTAEPAPPPSQEIPEPLPDDEPEPPPPGHGKPPKKGTHL